VENSDQKLSRLESALAQAMADANEVLWHLHGLQQSLRDLKMQVEVQQNLRRATAIDAERALYRDRKRQETS